MISLLSGARAIAVAAIFGAIFISALPGLAADAPAGGAMKGSDCHSDMIAAGHMMDSAMMKGKMTGDVDHDAAMMLTANHHQMMALAKLEAKCGKDPKVKAAAADALKAGLIVETKHPEFGSN